MKKRISLSALFHHDKLMMIFSLVLAIVIWALVVYGPSNIEEREITGVPVSIVLNEYASKTLNLQIVEGGNATATVRVSGTRAAIGKLSAQDIAITADTGNVIKEGTHELQLRWRKVTAGDYTIESVVGSNGIDDTITITCDVWREQNFPIEVEMPNLTVTDANNYRFGTATVGGEAITEGMVTVAGPKMAIASISRVVARIEEEATISETTVYTASLFALDEEDHVVEAVSFLRAEDAKVSVTVPVMEYRKVALLPTVRNVPSGYADKKDLVTVSPSEVELWGVPSELEEYIAAIQQQLVVDFDALTSDTLSRSIKLEETAAVRPLNGSETVKVKVNLSDVTSKSMEIPLLDKNFVVTNCPSGFTVKITQEKLPSVLFYGTKKALGKLNPEKVRIVVDMDGAAAVGQQTMLARLVVEGSDTVWANYGEAAGIEVLVSVTET